MTMVLTWFEWEVYHLTYSVYC